ncbi:hypothetical protein VNI00_007072 [Paramarasmius palmivorus]|uniref:Uncharacterized protein n=1 Tax=Paramarasmius palmivorus TaxID=297713 RepID=A0AAW0D2V2_9AGAR
MTFTTQTIPPLALGLPPSPDNAQPVISIDRTCALYSLQVAHMGYSRKAAEVPEERTMVENELSEGPRLFRILNDVKSTSRRPVTECQTKSPTYCSIRRFQSERGSSGFTKGLSPWVKRMGWPVPKVSSPRYSETSLLSLEQKVIQKPSPRSLSPLYSDEDDVPFFTNPFDDHKPIPIPAPLPGVPADGIINLDDYDLLESQPENEFCGSDGGSDSSEDMSENSTPENSPRAHSPYDLFATAHYPPSPPGFIHTSRVYPSSTAPGHRMNVGWSYMKPVGKPTFRVAEVPIQNPRPQSGAQSQMLQRMLKEMGCRRD